VQPDVLLCKTVPLCKARWREGYLMRRFVKWVLIGLAVIAVLIPVLYWGINMLIWSFVPS
jgi:hypothetical protein